MRTEKDDMITRELLSLFEETFEKVHGSYLDKGSSLFETLDRLDHKKASKGIDGIAETICGHVNHLLFYIVVLQEYITKKRTEKTDWSESWKIRSVSAGEWTAMKSTLKEEYGNLRLFIKRLDEWDHEDYFGGIVAILVHCSYHLGSIRQLIAFV